MKCFEGCLILSDMDGTLLDENCRISKENRTAIAYFMENGGLFTVATGRSKAGMEHFFPELVINAPAILYNGSVVRDFARGEDIWSANVGENGYILAKRLAEALPELGIEAYSGHTPYVAKANRLTELHFASVKMNWNPCPPEMIPQPWLSLVVNGNPEELQETDTLIREEFPGLFFTQYSSHTMLEIMRHDANKGFGSLHLQSLLGVDPRKVFAVGDGLNDVQLLESAYHSCAPENACPEILRIARHVLPHHKDHAIASLIDAIGKGELE